MKISIILAHPDPTSFNASIARIAAEVLSQNGHEVILRDLYREKFDPILHDEETPQEAAVPEAITEHCQQIAEADGIIIVHPNWWGQPPAILKGWVDRVIRPGIAYEFLEGDSGEGIPNGLLKAHSAIVFNTSNTGTEREHTVFGDPLERIWKDCIFDLCGVRQFHRRMFNIMITSTPEERADWLKEVKQLVNQVYPSL